MQPQYSYAIKNARGQVMATVSCPSARQAFANANLVIITMRNQERSARVLDIYYYAEPIQLQ